MWRPDAPKPMDPGLLEKKLVASESGRKVVSTNVRLLRERFPIRLGTNTDCFQPVERRMRVTERVMRILNGWSYPYIINTKSDMVAEEPYKTLISQAPGGCVVQFTILSLDQSLVSKLEPKAPSVERRLAAASDLSGEGVPVQVRVSPIVPGLTSELDDFEGLVRASRDAGAEDVIVEFLRYTGRIRKWVEEGSDGEIDLDTMYKDLGVKLRADGRPKADRDGYVRVPMKKKFGLYKRYKEVARKLGMNFYVCSEEYPEINKCANCCGISHSRITDRFPGFKLHNDASANTIACFIKERGKVTLNDIKNNFYCVDWKCYSRLWERLDRFLVNVRKVEENGKTAYEYVEGFSI